MTKTFCVTIVTALLLCGCATPPSSSQRVEIEGQDTLAVKSALARRVLAALPEEQVRRQVRQRFPQLSEQDTTGIRLRLTHVEFNSPAVLAHVNNNRTQLVVVVDETAALRPVTGQVREFVAALLRAELRRQGGRSAVSGLSR